MNQNLYEPNLCYNSISFGFDQFQPPQFSVIHQPPQETNSKILQARENLMEAIQAFLKKYDHIPHIEKCMDLLLAEERFLKVKQALEEGQNQPENVQELLLKPLNDLQILNKMQLKQEEQAAKICTPYWKCLIFDDDDDEEYTIQVREYYKNSLVAITLDFPITDSLIMEDEHLDTILETESDEENESSIEDFNLTLSESEDLFNIESECDVPVCDDFTTFFDPLFDSYADSTSSDDESFFDEDVLKENFKIYSNTLFYKDIISTKIDLHQFNAESDLIESLLNRDTLIGSSPKFDSLLEEFFGELTHIDLISLETDEADFDPEKEIHLVEKLLYDNSSPRPLEQLNFENSDAVIESFSPSPIPVEGSDSLIEEIDIFLASDDSIPPGIENDDYDSKEDILEELLNNDSLSLPENELFHFDRYYDLSSPRPPAKPPDDDGIYSDAEPNTGIFTVKVVDDISERYVLKPRILPTQPTLSVCPVIDTLLPFSSKNEDKLKYGGSSLAQYSVIKISASWVATHAYPFSFISNKCDVRRFASSFLVFRVL
uniref:Reverse transcriptase domain-containing protein n=1 Tax=Tanacetum cinerariifolium TaxID=118510 RepID=A0A699HBM2_TANCI|nr:hypothetical protein [Tanacetum cinerariifolium]